MSNRRTFAVLGVSETNSIFLAKQIAKTNPVLLFDRDVVVLKIVYSQILLEHPNANAEMMICPTNASWEADVIILSNAAATDGNLIEKIRNVATGKIVLFFRNKKNTNTSENTDEKLQHLFPFSKVVHSFESAVDSNNSLFLNGNDKEAIKAILTLFTSIGLKADILYTNINLKKNQMSKSILFQPYTLGNSILKNRMVMAPMTRSRSNNEGNVPTALTAEYYAQRATAGLIVSEGTFVSTKAVGFINVPGIYSAAQTEGWKLVTEAVHEKGGTIFAQLWHTGRLSHPDLHNGELPHAPSALNPFAKAYTNDGFVDTVVPKEMTIEDIKQTVLDFKNGAKNAIAAGFDGAELHAANGYLLQQFFNGYSNHRSDEYGGSIENKSRILFDILDALEGVIDYNKVGVRLNPSLHNAQGMMLDEQTIPTYEYIINKLNDYGLAYIHLTEPFTDVTDVPFAVTEVAKHFRPFYRGTLIINKSFNKETGIKVIEDGYADLVAYGVPFIANPDLVARYETDAPLNTPDQTTFYTDTVKGYTDYPAMSE